MLSDHSVTVEKETGESLNNSILSKLEYNIIQDTSTKEI